MIEVATNTDHQLCIVRGQSGDESIHVRDLSRFKGCCGKMAQGVNYDKIVDAKCEMG